MAAMADHVFTPRRDSEITCFTCGRDESDPVHTLYFNRAQLAVIHMMTTGNYSADWWAGYAYAKAQAVTLLESRFPPKPAGCRVSEEQIQDFAQTIRELFTTLRDAPVWEKLDQELYEAWVEEMQGRAADMLERMPQKRD
jgi:hypothetical protein